MSVSDLNRSETVEAPILKTVEAAYTLQKRPQVLQSSMLTIKIADGSAQLQLVAISHGMAPMRCVHYHQHSTGCTFEVLPNMEVDSDRASVSVTTDALRCQSLGLCISADLLQKSLSGPRCW